MLVITYVCTNTLPGSGWDVVGLVPDVFPGVHPRDQLRFDVDVSWPGVWLMWLASMAYHGLGGKEEELYGIAFNLHNTLERLLCCSGLLLRVYLLWCCCTGRQGVPVGGGECGVAA